MIDPLERWRKYGEKPDYAGLLTFGALPYTQDPARLDGCDVAIVGAPMDDLVSDRPGARLAPRAIRGASCPAGPHLETKVDVGTSPFSLVIRDAQGNVLLESDPAAPLSVTHNTNESTTPLVTGFDYYKGEDDPWTPETRVVSVTNDGSTARK